MPPRALLRFRLLLAVACHRCNFTAHLWMPPCPLHWKAKPWRPQEWPDVSQGFPGSSAAKESACIAGDPGSIPGSGRSTGEGIGYPLRYSWASLVAQLVKNLPAMRETWVRSLGWKIRWRRERLPPPVFWPGEVYTPL